MHNMRCLHLRGSWCSAQGYAVKAGMLVGRGERLLFMDADGATRVSDLEKLEAALASILAAQGDGYARNGLYLGQLSLG